MNVGHLLQSLRKRRKIGVRVYIERNRELTLRVADTKQAFDHVVAIGAGIRQSGAYAIEHVADTAQGSLDRIDRLGNQVGAEFDRPQRGPPEGLSERFGLRHFLDGGDGIELVKAQLGEFDPVKGKLSI
jgi:hypothetical protein